MPRKKKPKSDRHIKFHKQKDVINLQRQWYDKLAKSGFEDCEWTNDYGEHGHLFKKNSTGDLRRTFSSTVETYYAMARNFACHGTFTSNLDKFIWENHSEGISYRDISLKLKKKYRLKRKHLHYSSICLRVKRMRQEMFLFEASHPESLTLSRELFEDSDGPEHNKPCL